MLQVLDSHLLCVFSWLILLESFGLLLKARVMVMELTIHDIFFLGFEFCSAHVQQHIHWLAALPIYSVNAYRFPLQGQRHESKINNSEKQSGRRSQRSTS